MLVPFFFHVYESMLAYLAVAGACHGVDGALGHARRGVHVGLDGRGVVLRHCSCSCNSKRVVTGGVVLVELQNVELAKPDLYSCL